MESEFRLKIRRQAHAELLSRGWGTTIPEEDIELTRPIEDLESLSLLKNGLLEAPKHIRLDTLQRVWSVDAFSKTKPDEKFDKLLIGEFRSLFQFMRLGVRDGLRWTHISKQLTPNKPL